MVKRTTKFLTREQRLRLKRGEKLDTTRDPFKVKTKELSAQQRVELQQSREQLIQEVKRIDSFFIKNNFGGSLSNFNREYNNLKKTNPVVANRLKVTPQFVQNELNNRIKTIESKIKRTKEREEKADKRDNKPKEKELRAEGRAYKQALQRLKGGEILSINDIDRFASDTGRVARKKAQAKERERELKAKVVQQVEKKQILSKKTTGKVLVATAVKIGDPEKKSFIVRGGKVTNVRATKKNIDKEIKALEAKGKDVQLKKLKIPVPSERLIKDFKKTNFKRDEQNVFLKAVSGQTLTSKEKNKLNTIIQKKNKDLTSTQLNLLKNAPKDVATGLFEVGKEIVLIPVDAVKASFKFGKNLRKRAEAGENNPLKNDIVKLGKGTISVAKFVKNNPEQAAAITAAGTAAVGKDVSAAFRKNPVKATTKAVAYLFPGTIIKGGVKAAGLGVKGVKVGAQAVNLVRANNKVKLAVAKGGLTAKQLKSVNTAVVKASKVAGSAKQDKILKTALGKVLRDRGVKVRKGASVSTLSKEVAGSKDIIKVKKIVKKPAKPKKITPAKLKKAKVEIGPVAKIQKTKKVPKKRAIRVKVKDKKLVKVTKKEFEAAKVKRKPGRPKKTVKKVKEIDVTKLEKKAFEKKLAQKGVIEEGKTIFIDLNAVKRLENAKVPVKAVVSNKKAQVQFQIQIQKQVRVYKRTIKAAKKTKQVSSIELLKIDRGAKKLLSILRNPKLVNLLGRAALIRSLIDTIKDANAVKKAPGIAKTPAKKAPTKAKTPAKAKAPAKAKVPAKAAKPKVATKPKLVTPRVKVAKPRIVRPVKKPVRPVKIPRLPLPKLRAQLKTGERISFHISYKLKGKPVLLKVNLPKNKALKRAQIELKNKKLPKIDIIAVGATKLKDIKKPVIDRKLQLVSKDTISTLKRR